MSGARQLAERRGHRGENLAAWWLRLKGHRILGRRIRTHAGEIDLVTLSPFGPVCFIEVKLRADARTAAESVTPAQRTRIARAATLYLASHPPWPGAAPGSTSWPWGPGPGITATPGVLTI